MERSLEGWVVKDWTIRPKLVAVLNFGNFRASPGKEEAHWRWAKLLFARPGKIAIVTPAGVVGVGWVVEHVAYTHQTGESSCRIELSNRGSIEIHAEEQQIFFW